MACARWIEVVLLVSSTSALSTPPGVRLSRDSTSERLTRPSSSRRRELSVTAEGLAPALVVLMLVLGEQPASVAKSAAAATIILAFMGSCSIESSTRACPWLPIAKPARH